MASIWPENYRKLRKIKERTYELLLRTSAHGIPRLLLAKNILTKIIWAAILITSSTLGSYFILKNIMQFVKYETVVTFDIIENYVVEFPTISFCASPQLTTTINETFLKLRINRQFTTNFTHYFETFNDSIYGRCYRFNSGRNFFGESVKPVESTRSGHPYGLRIDMHIEPPEGHDFSELLVNIHNRSTPPVDLYDGGHWITTGAWSYFEIEWFYQIRLEPPYNNCFRNVSDFQNNKTLIEFILSKNRTYTQNDCFHYCEYLYAVQNSTCNCTTSLDNFENECIRAWFEILEYDEKKLCVENYLVDFRTKRHLYCLNYCPLECESFTFKVTPFMEKFSVSGNMSNFTKFSNGIQKYETYEQVNKHYISFFAYLKDLKNTVIKQKPKMETYDCIANIGGVFGLFFGISFISFVEIIEIFIETLIIYLND